MAVAMEAITRPFVAIETRPQEAVQVAPPSDLEALPVAYAAWGARSEFITPEMQLDKPFIVEGLDSGGTFTARVEWLESGTSIFDDPPDDDTPEPLVETVDWPEVSRTVSVVRIFNPEDGSQYVDVERIETITFRRDDGVLVRYILNHGDA